MPKKRKINISQNISDPIPFPKYRVLWVDCVSDSGWANETDFKKMKLATPVNEGWIFSKDKDSVKMFASYDKEDDGSFTFGDRTMIPRAWVRKMVKI